MPPPAAPAAPPANPIAELFLSHTSEFVKINLPCSQPLAFTPRQARALAQSLMKAARDAEDLQRQAKRGATYQAKHAAQHAAELSEASSQFPAAPQRETANSKLETSEDMSPDEELSYDTNGKA